jgi:sugar/nucleoside kinase (ribokinase family)
MAKKRHFDVLVIGSACVDLVFGGMPHWPVLGQEMYVDQFAISVGAIFNTAATLSRLQVGLLTELGSDFCSRYIFEELEKAGVSRDLVVIHDSPMRSLSVCMAYEGERGFVSYSDKHPGKATRAEGEGREGGEQPSLLLIQKLQQALEEYAFDAVFMYAHPTDLPFLNVVEEFGQDISIFFDTGWGAQCLSNPQMCSVIRRGDYIMPNQAEAMAMTSTETAEAAATALAELIPTAIVKVGARGAIACRQEELMYCPAYPIQQVVDTTGAGDAFNGGLIYGILKGYTLPKALRCGTICGSLSTMALSGTAAVPTAGQLERLLSA